MGTYMHEVAKQGPVNLIPKVSLTNAALRLKKINERGHTIKKTRFYFKPIFVTQ